MSEFSRRGFLSFITAVAVFQKQIQPSVLVTKPLPPVPAPVILPVKSEIIDLGIPRDVEVEPLAVVDVSYPGDQWRRCVPVYDTFVNITIVSPANSDLCRALTSLMLSNRSGKFRLTLPTVFSASLFSQFTFKGFLMSYCEECFLGDSFLTGIIELTIKLKLRMIYSQEVEWSEV